MLRMLSLVALTRRGVRWCSFSFPVGIRRLGSIIVILNLLRATIIVHLWSGTHIVVVFGTTLAIWRLGWYLRIHTGCCLGYLAAIASEGMLAVCIRESIFKHAIVVAYDCGQLGVKIE